MMKMVIPLAEGKVVTDTVAEDYVPLRNTQCTPHSNMCGEVPPSTYIHDPPGRGQPIIYNRSGYRSCLVFSRFDRLLSLLCVLHLIFIQVLALNYLP